MVCGTETIFSASEKMVCVTLTTVMVNETMVFANEKIFFMAETRFFHGVKTRLDFANSSPIGAGGSAIH
jgi:hypothetical protein